MKRILALALAFVLLLCTGLCFTSCGGVSTDTIDGKAPDEAYFESIERMEDLGRHQISVSVKTGLKLAVVKVPLINQKNAVIHNYDGDNWSYYTSEKFFDSLEDVNTKRAMAEIDGVFYYVDSSENVKTDDPDDWDVEESEYQQTVAELLRREGTEVECYKQLNGYYFVIEIDEDSDNYYLRLYNESVKETYTVYLDKEGRLTKIVLEADLGLAYAKIVSEYEYDKLDALKAPTSVDEFK